MYVKTFRYLTKLGNSFNAYIWTSTGCGAHDYFSLAAIGKDEIRHLITRDEPNKKVPLKTIKVWLISEDTFYEHTEMDLTHENIRRHVKPIWKFISDAIKNRVKGVAEVVSKWMVEQMIHQKE